MLLHHHLSTNPTSLKPEERGLRLIQLLLAGAAHVSSGNLSRADSCLHLISAMSSPSGDSMQRLSSILASSLATRLLRRRLPGLLSAVHPPRKPLKPLTFARTLPYIPFTHTATSRVLLRAIAHERNVHVVDLSAAAHSLDLWAPFLRTISRLPHGPPHLKLTCVSGDHHVLESLGTALVKEADSLDVPFRFHAVHSVLSELDLDTLRVHAGEALFFVSLFKLHELLAGEVERMNGLLLEQEAEHNSERMAERFVEGLHHYSALFDSVEAVAAMGAMGEEERREVEEMVGREIENIVACEGVERVERHEKTTKWVVRMERAGFRQGRFWGDAVEEGRRVVESWAGGFAVVVECGCLMICWHDKPLYSISAWHS
ncbi:Scarecrow-like protein 3 [Dioscorea alata]|uniref:Scarecrow-like protein 3 n=1 Tax=Dioscorea alata TaxID=55571 RepID=A0ACB7UW97_DIOAL|nr:Scarecrow-like protein 3 [Dioscorea alata]